MTEPNSPTPWAPGLLPRCSKFIILAAEDSRGLRDDVAEFLQVEDRDFALRAANSHEELLAALQHLVGVYEDTIESEGGTVCPNPRPKCPYPYCKANKAIAAAERRTE